jgi:hypothetical protein
MWTFSSFTSLQHIHLDSIQALENLCPTEDESGMLMSLLSVNVHMHRWMGKNARQGA